VTGILLSAIFVIDVSI